MIAQTTAQKAPNSQSAAVAQKTAAQMATETSTNGTPTNGTSASTTAGGQT
jgi:hypothetical protein